MTTHLPPTPRAAPSAAPAAHDVPSCASEAAADPRAVDERQRATAPAPARGERTTPGSAAAASLTNDELVETAVRIARTHDEGACWPYMQEMQKRGMDIYPLGNILWPPAPRGRYVPVRPANYPRRRT